MYRVHKVYPGTRYRGRSGERGAGGGGGREEAREERETYRKVQYTAVAFSTNCTFRAKSINRRILGLSTRGGLHFN